MLWLLALYSILITASSSYPQSPSSNDGQTVYVSNPAGPFEMGGDSLSVSAGTPLDDINKLNPSFIPPLDYMKTNLGNLPDTTYQQTQIDAPPEITSSQTIPFAQISFDKNSKPPAAFNQALMDEDSPSVPLLDLFRSFPSNIDIPYSGESSGEQKPTDPNPVETGGEEEAKQPRYDPEERVGNPGPPECGQGRYAMCCNRAPVYNSLRQVPQWRGDCRLCMSFLKKPLCRNFHVDAAFVSSTTTISVLNSPPFLLTSTKSSLSATPAPLSSDALLPLRAAFANKSQLEPTGKAVTGAKTCSAAHAKTG